MLYRQDAITRFANKNIIFFDEKFYNCLALQLNLLEYLFQILSIDNDVTHAFAEIGSGRRDQSYISIECDISRQDKAEVNSINRWKCHDRFTTSSARFAIGDRRRGRWTPVEVESLGNVRATGGKAIVVLSKVGSISLFHLANRRFRENSPLSSFKILISFL